jgi:HEAT repeat protein
MDSVVECSRWYTMSDLDMSMEKPENKWYENVPPRGGVYDLAEMAQYGKSAEDRLQAVSALGKSDDPRAVRPLMDLLGSAEPAIRLSATNALGLLKSGRSVEVLIDRLRDRSEQIAVRHQAALALAAIRSTGAIRGLREFVEDPDEDAEVRFSAGQILAKVDTW